MKLARKLSCALLALGLCAPFSGSAAADQDSSLRRSLDAAMADAVAKKRVAGAVLLVAINGETVYANAVGAQDCGGARAMKTDSLFRYSSVTKLFTAMAAAVLIEKGIIGLDDPVTKWLPDFRPPLPDGAPAIITIRQLMAHQAGLDYGFFETADGPYIQAGVSDGLDDAKISLAENLRRLGGVPLLFRPGEGWRYSLASDVLGAVIEKAYGRPLDKAMEELVSAPLKLGDASFTAMDASRLTGACVAGENGPVAMKKLELVPVGEGVVRFSPDRILDKGAYPSGGAGMAGSAADILTLIEVVRTGGAPLIGPGLMAEMNKDAANGQAMEPGFGFGLGWGVVADPELAKPYSAGALSWGGVYGHSWIVDPARKLSVVLMTNTALEGMMGPTKDEIVKAIYANIP